MTYFTLLDWGLAQDKGEVTNNSLLIDHHEAVLHAIREKASNNPVILTRQQALPAHNRYWWKSAISRVTGTDQTYQDT